MATESRVGMGWLYRGCSLLWWGSGKTEETPVPYPLN